MRSNSILVGQPKLDTRTTPVESRNADFSPLPSFHALDLLQPSLTGDDPTPLVARTFPALKRLPIPLAGSFPLLVSIGDWADEINRCNDLQTNNLVAFGCLIHASKLSLKHGQWEEMFRRRQENGLAFGKTTGKKWALIGEVYGQNGQEPDHLKNLPCGFEALYQVSRLGMPLVLELIADGAIRRDLSEAKAKELVKMHRPELCKPRPFKLKNWSAQLDRLVGVIEEKGGPEDRAEAVRRLEEAIERLRVTGRNGTEANEDNEGEQGKAE